MSDKPNVIVCQHGARLRYAVPRMLEQAGMLEALYTDSSAHSILGRLAGLVEPFAFGSLKRLIQRSILGVPLEKVFSSDRLFLSDCWAIMFGKDKNKQDKLDRQQNAMSKAFIKRGVSNANVIYNMYCENIDFVRYAKSKGLKIVTDVYMNPIHFRLVKEEAENHIDWPFHSNIEMIEYSENKFQEVMELSDLLLCPSDWVVEGIKLFQGFDRNKIKVVPYGSSVFLSDEKNRPIVGRILFVGRDALGKGLPYLARAADILKPKHPDWDFRIVGITEKKIVSLHMCKNLNFVSKFWLTIDQIKSEFLTADLFVLPTLSEGISGVCIEAMAAGVPVITTKCAGMRIESGKDGIIVPERDGNILADAIASLVSNRSKRNAIAYEAVISARYYTEEAWQKRLIKVLQIDS